MENKVALVFDGCCQKYVIGIVDILVLSHGPHGPHSEGLARRTTHKNISERVQGPGRCTNPALIKQQSRQSVTTSGCQVWHVCSPMVLD